MGNIQYGIEIPNKTKTKMGSKAEALPKRSFQKQYLKMST